MEDTTLWDKVNRITARGTGKMMYSNRRAQQTGLGERLRIARLTEMTPNYFKRPTRSHFQWELKS